MLQRTAALAYTAISAKSGKKYPEQPSKELSVIAEVHLFKSPYWITSTQVRHFDGLSIKPDVTGFPLTFDFGGGKAVTCTIYNADQTTDPSLIERHIEELKKNGS
eukprot:CAMPEP_0201478948 /NCGR_PEP_ID=MMETSP0151_2-20130828/3702_1 /ASSEMBLY_ACC=CAM_ASM_000257 /TAXON_ID=200890 /ORGANISM="Paramoeba atlantica, Strain 621/1 / CCAP 1560/9" /LENGTH=104 /DNA_ID=CAMNT_0047860221 /DNA_START=52 /DNA_END=366 /DNA_ORIENTATION=-